MRALQRGFFIVFGCLWLAHWGVAQVAPPAPSANDSVARPLPPHQALGAAPVPAPKHRLPLVIGTFATGYAGTYYTLSKGWYTGPRSRFHWFDDSREWKQLDKAGHLWGAFHESRGAVDLLHWAGLTPKQAIWYGGFVGFLLQSPIEYFDGRDPAYGASATDLAANFAGSAGLIAQQLTWGEVRLMPKVSFRTTPYAQRRPNVLGKNLGERLLKDYNGQTYWLCADVGAFLPEGNRWPRWLQPTLGYGAQQMLYNDPDTNRAAGLDAYRQYYLSFDIDLRHIPTRSKALRTVFYVASIFHLPAPALELNRKRGLVLHGLYH
ncbi:YfiM family protein [Solirubrum puertoriconensis]|uniref:YfiM family protein n=1 Tax=Solirubrum puertoriconensis TaxID=1751427 RepID=UPI000A57F840|nr:YfiM family protein [Solirubrum puertoriconensis]